MNAPEGTGPTRLRFSVIIPTFQRRDLVLRGVTSLGDQTFPGSYEVIVVVDGSSDGSGDALRNLDTPFPLTVVEQPNQGASVARNRGASEARGEILLFVDDDMECDRGMLAAHDRSHREGADVVLGHMPLHPESPPSILIRGIEDWAAERVERLAAPDAVLTLHDLLTGQLSISRESFDEIGGFAVEFTLGGTFGNEDVDFGYRALLAGCRVVFAADAISRQYYDVHPAELLRRYREVGRADVAFARKHPEKAVELFQLNEYEGWRDRLVWRPLARLPIVAPCVSGLLRRVALGRMDRGSQSERTRRFFSGAWRMEYWRGVAEAGGIPRRRPLHVLSYHAIRDLGGTGELEPYGVPPKEFATHLEMLRRAGYHFVSADELLRFLDGSAGLPRRPLLLTFDDGYEELVDRVLPILVERRIPAVVFAVSGRIGGTNAWDESLGGPELRLLDADGLVTLAGAGIEIGVHSRTHPMLTEVSDAELEDEIAGAAADLGKMGFRPRLFAYPYGDADERVRRSVEDAGLEAAFSVQPGSVRPGMNRFDLPRIEILRGDGNFRIRWKLASARLRGSPLM